MAKEPFGTALVTGTLFVGLSAVIGLTQIPGQAPPTILRTFSGGTLEILGFAGSAQGTGFTGGPPGFTVGGGYQVIPGTTLPPMSLNTCGTIWFVATGVTAAVNYVQHRSQDFS